MATIRFLLGIVCFVTVGSGWLPGGHYVKGTNATFLAENTTLSLGSPAFYTKTARQDPAPGASEAVYGLNLKKGHPVNDRAAARVLQKAVSQLGVKELTGNNDGEAIEAYLAYVHLKKGQPWCAAFVSWAFGQAGYPLPRTGWCPALFATGKATTAKPAAVFGIYFHTLKRIAHCGLVERRQGNWILSIEGNTNAASGREGDGVYRKRRHLKTIAGFADWTR